MERERPWCARCHNRTVLTSARRQLSTIAAPKAACRLTTNYCRSAVRCAENPVANTTVRQTGVYGQGAGYCDYRGPSGTNRFPTPRQFVMFSLCPKFSTSLNEPVGKDVILDRPKIDRLDRSMGQGWEHASPSVQSLCLCILLERPIGNRF